jgi:hypothetical protein
MRRQKAEFINVKADGVRSSHCASEGASDNGETQPADQCTAKQKYDIRILAIRPLAYISST